jgi:HAE1 family hydrophobic/amphiphilic exporter-1
MTLSDLSIKNPVFAWMLMVGLIVFGAIGFTRLGKSQLPDVDFPVVTVQTSWEGASPEIMETEVTDVIEGAMTQVQGVKSITSTSRQGQAIITVEFDLDRDLDAAMQEVESRISQAQYNLPNEMDPAIISKFNPEDQPIMWLALSGDRPLREMMEYVKDVLKDQFTTIPGVGDVMLGGGSRAQKVSWCVLHSSVFLLPLETVQQVIRFLSDAYRRLSLHRAHP